MRQLSHRLIAGILAEVTSLALWGEIQQPRVGDVSHENDPNELIRVQHADAIRIMSIVCLIVSRCFKVLAELIQDICRLSHASGPHLTAA